MSDNSETHWKVDQIGPPWCLGVMLQIYAQILQMGTLFPMGRANKHKRKEGGTRGLLILDVNKWNVQPSTKGTRVDKGH
jgi:hypothetical protein